eukprot:TRINITY_DN11502_c0_g1_i2.p1 TRINITY_DN11502_c0_g1~~TRINITY_DN11502_c0_g1_i2.p1  ORF type:complete len:449 (+),score=77.78 TRINITY_DN11502_c0_g1_i2:73-1419(+)
MLLSLCQSHTVRLFSTRSLPQRVRGTRDLIGKDCRRWEFAIDTASRVSILYGYNRIETPVLEEIELFTHSLGETSDVVHKEMYRVMDRSDGTPPSICLRPENTAGVARAFANASLQHDLPQRLYYHGPMFRYERPQKGRYRQFTQFGAELIGSHSPLAELEVVQMAHQFLRNLGVLPQVELQINTLGDQISRQNFKTALEAFLKPISSSLSKDSQMRLERGSVLRILDSKDEGDRMILAKAPRLQDYQTEQSRNHFHDVQTLLKEANISYIVQDQLVRGLDYYTQTIFEFVMKDANGAQNAVLAGGRYDDLIGVTAGSQSIPGIGWAAGIDRLLPLIPEDAFPTQSRNVLVCSAQEGDVHSDSQQLLRKVSTQLRENGISVVNYPGWSLKKQLHKANTRGDTALVVIVGTTQDSAKERIVIRNFATGKEKVAEMDNLVADVQNTLLNL